MSASSDKHVPYFRANRFAAFARNVHSQFGEDGILEGILGCLDKTDQWCVEFGAWDGVYLSNTCHLIKNKGYKSVLIEADKGKFVDLQRNMEGCDAVMINEFVMFEGPNTLDGLLSRTEIPTNFDFLSIDIDGNDYWILESLHKYRPKIMCIEFNPSIPNDVHFAQAKDFHVKHGSSARAILELARAKGYELAAVTSCNLILIDADLWSLLGLESKELDDFRDDSDSKVYVFVGYDGSVHLSRPFKLIWHNVNTDDRDYQVLPGYLKRYMPDYNRVQRRLFTLFLSIRRWLRRG